MNNHKASMKRAKLWFVVVAGIACGLAVGHGADRGASKADSPKGKWGRVTPIADTNHPNLYYDRGEIQELRQMMRVQHSPQHLYERYQAEIKDAVAVKTIPDNKSPHRTNMKAALGYAIEPTTDKAMPSVPPCSVLSAHSRTVCLAGTALPGVISPPTPFPGCCFEDLSFEEALQREEGRLAGERDKMIADGLNRSYNYAHYSYKARGRYAEQLRHWFDLFPRDQFLILKNEDLARETQATFDRVYKFLGIPTWHPKEHKRHNTAEYDKMNPETRAMLVEYFKPHNRALSDLLGMEFGWDT